MFSEDENVPLVLGGLSTPAFNQHSNQTWWKMVEESNHTTARKPGPLQIIPYSLQKWVSRKAGKDRGNPSIYYLSMILLFCIDCGLLPISHFIMRGGGQWSLLLLSIQGIPMLCATDRIHITDSHIQVVLAFTVLPCLGAWMREKEHIKYSIKIQKKSLQVGQGRAASCFLLNRLLQ